MLGLIFSIVFCCLQWLSIWAAVTNVKTKKPYKAGWTFRHLLCTMGIPAIIGAIFAVVAYFVSISSFIVISVYVGISVLALFVGSRIHLLIWKKDAHLKNPDLHHKKKKKKKK